MGGKERQQRDMGHIEIGWANRDSAAQARGVVVIDVIRAFSVAAYAFAGGARGLWLVRKRSPCGSDSGVRTSNM
jgi:hypothetical protein